MRKLAAAVMLFVSVNCVAQSLPSIYVKASPEFSGALAAALLKKHVPVTVLTTDGGADYILQAAPVMSKEESGAGKVARCMFLDCIGINGFSAVSVELLRSKDGSVVWAYQVRKGMSGPAGIQSLSEAIAKHLKHDYLDKHER